MLWRAFHNTSNQIRVIHLRRSKRPHVIRLRSVHPFHSLVEVQTKQAIHNYVPCMRNSNLEITTADSFCHPQTPTPAGN